jgi:Ser/Thr protein kinase RdoA (MazF antagonist)
MAQIELVRPFRKFPHYLDLSTPKKWSGLVKEIQARLESLVEAGTFRQVTRKAAREVFRWANPPAVLDLYHGPVGLVHGDLTAENIFVLGDGSYRVIDWQRPLLAPTAVDLVNLLPSLGCDPTGFALQGAQRMRDCLLLHWWVECARRWYPPAAGTYDGLAAELLGGESML